MLTLDKADLKRAEIKDSSDISTAELLIIQRASLLERLKNIRTEEISVDTDAPTGKLWNDSIRWYNRWNNTWDNRWHNRSYSLIEEKPKQDNEEEVAINPVVSTF